MNIITWNVYTVGHILNSTKSTCTLDSTYSDFNLVESYNKIMHKLVLLPI